MLEFENRNGEMTLKLESLLRIKNQKNHKMKTHDDEKNRF